MKIEEQSVELVKETNILKKIELAGRCCYNSQNMIKEDSYEKFIKKAVTLGHYSVLEHSNIIIKYGETDHEEDLGFVYECLQARKGKTNSHLWITFETCNDKTFIMMSGNVKAWMDFFALNNDDDDSIDDAANIYDAMKEQYPILFAEESRPHWTNTKVEFLTETEAAAINIDHTSYTFKIVTSRDITHQIVRHRTLSFSQQSQRYCNYTLEKNGDEITFIKPRFEEGSEVYNDWKEECERINSLYAKFIANGVVPEVARSILPNSTKAIIYVTGHYEDWLRFINLRSSDGAQQEIREISNKIDKEIKKCYI